MIASFIDKSTPPSDHLVFFVHGMGQQYEKYGNMKHHVSTMEKNTVELLSSRYPNQNIRVKYVAIEWHSEVHEKVDAKMNKTTLSTVPKVRLATNDWLMDCLYYFTKPYGQCIIDSVCRQCNTAYNEYKIINPNFDGQNVHFIGFSLGGIIAYDIASMQWLKEDGIPPWKSKVLNEMACPTPDIIVPKLAFKIRCLFTCGSPIAAGLVCRGLDYMYYRPPLRTKIFNVFHPFDPLGYRLEPMVNSSYETVDPVHIYRLKSSLPRIPDLGIKSSFAKGKPLLQSFWQYFSSTVTSNTTDTSISSSPVSTSATTTTSSLTTTENEAIFEQEEISTTRFSVKRKLSNTSSPTLQESNINTKKRRVILGDITQQPNGDDEQKMLDIVIEGKDGCLYPRMDYVLSENIIDAYASEWIVALKSHFRYWANRDLTLHIIKVILNDE